MKSQVSSSDNFFIGIFCCLFFKYQKVRSSWLFLVKLADQLGNFFGEFENYFVMTWDFSVKFLISRLSKWCHSDIAWGVVNPLSIGTQIINLHDIRLIRDAKDQDSSQPSLDKPILK